MKRRAAVRNLVITTAGVAIFPGCGLNNVPKAVELSKIKISGTQSLLLASLTQAIIPTTDTPGAKEVKTDEHILLMVNDCASPADQQKFLDRLDLLEKVIRERYRKPFSSLNDSQKKEFLTGLESKDSFPPEVKEFYRYIKRATIQHYTGSEYFMTNVLEYKIIPRPYKGCVPATGT